jgi:hypothetical protein
MISQARSVNIWPSHSELMYSSLCCSSVRCALIRCGKSIKRIQQRHQIPAYALFVITLPSSISLIGAGYNDV